MRGQTSISSDTPVWIPQAVVTFGMVLLALQFLARFIQAAARPAARGSRMKAARRGMIAEWSRQALNGHGTMLEVVITMFAILFAVLAGGLWIG